MEKGALLELRALLSEPQNKGGAHVPSTETLLLDHAAPKLCAGTPCRVASHAMLFGALLKLIRKVAVTQTKKKMKKKTFDQ